MAEGGGMDKKGGGLNQGASNGHASGTQPSMFQPPPPLSGDSTSLWTQFSGMPSHPQSPSSLHQWLHAMDGPGLSSDVFPRMSGPQPGVSFASTGAPKSAGNIGPIGNLSADFASSSATDGLPKKHPANTRQFDFGSASDFDFSSSQPHRYSNSQIGDVSHSPPVSLSGLPPADFSRPPPDFTFGATPDFSHPPPPFMPNLSHPPFPTADRHPPTQRDFSNSSDTRNGPWQAPDPLHHFHRTPVEAVSQPYRPGPKSHDVFSGHVNVSMPPPNYVPFARFGDDLFQRSADVDKCSQEYDVSSFEPDFGGIEGPAKPKKMVRQNSEPVYKTTAEDEGKAMYVEALRRLNSFGPSYEPFGSKPLVHDVPSEAAAASPESPPAAPSSKEAPKMSYSEVARCSMGKAAQTRPESTGIATKEKDREADQVQAKKAASDTTSKTFRQSNKRQSQSRSSNQRSRSSTSETGQNFMQSTSKYGLDQFEDVCEYAFGRGEHCSSSMESLNLPIPSAGTRKSSTSSMSSSTSAVEELFQGKAGISPSGGKVDAGITKQKEKPSNLDTKDHQTDNHAKSDTTTCFNTTISAHQAPKTAANPSAQKSKSEKLFFDPKRIFQSRGTSNKTQSMADRMKAAGESVNRSHSETADSKKEETVLNNGKPNNTSSKATSSTHRKADYINNDLREGSGGGGGVCGSGSKRTNQTAALNRNSQGMHPKRQSSQKDSCTQNGASETKLKGEPRGKKQESAAEEHAARENSFIRNIDWVLVDEWMKYISDCSMAFARSSTSAAVTVLLYLVGVIMYLVMGAIHLIAVGVSKVWSLLKGKLFKGDDQVPGGWGSFAGGSDNSRKRVGLEENIALPATGEEAMKRLLACKGKDPYSILGLRIDTSDEDIKRYYRKQAVLVHPDKNQEPGAEEAFKILGHAFEMIGEPAKRKEYDAHILEASEAEAAMREFSDLLTKLQEKMQEAANMMRCDNCGKKHRRIPVDRPWYSARYCERCHIHHTAKEGDVWAESSILGFLWHYYACMDGNIYDITEWVSCQRENFKHMKANAHPVFYRIQTDGNRRHRHGQSGEADLEDFINRLFSKTTMSPDGAPPPGWQFPSQQQGGGAGAQPGWGSSAGAPSSKRSRRKKKRN